jgi:catechol 2,3-dioxygenase-like lactoylglutathione lyase family enzyme
MDDALTTLFNDFDRGTISRRQLLQTLGLAAAATAVPFNMFAQGRCGGERAGTPDCDTTPAKAPFESTGWKTVYMDHFSLQCTDYEKEAAYYAALMNWKVRSDDGTKAYLDIGDDVGGVMLRGGYVAPPPPPPRVLTAAESTAAAARGGRGGGGGRGGPRTPLTAVWDSFCWGIDPWDTKKVEAELAKRGLNPVADHDGKNFQSFHVKDPDGFDVQISNGNKKNRRQGAAKASLQAAAPFEASPLKTIWLDHISFAVTNYKESTAWYQALLGWTPGHDEGSQNECQIGALGNIIIRGTSGIIRPGSGDSTAGGRGGQAAAPAPRHAVINHISFGISPWDTDGVLAELTKRGLSASPDTGGRLDIHDENAHFKSYHTRTPGGWDLQISNSTAATRQVR